MKSHSIYLWGYELMLSQARGLFCPRMIIPSESRSAKHFRAKLFPSPVMWALHNREHRQWQTWSGENALDAYSSSTQLSPALFLFSVCTCVCLPIAAPRKHVMFLCSPVALPGHLLGTSLLIMATFPPGQCGGEILAGLNARESSTCLPGSGGSFHASRQCQWE